MVGLQDCLTIPPSQLLDAIKVNTCGPLYLYQATHALLTSPTRGERARRPVFLITSSGAGCISASPGIPVGAYGTSKAAVNMLAREMHLQNEKTGLIVFPYHPGQSGRFAISFRLTRQLIPTWLGWHELDSSQNMTLTSTLTTTLNSSSPPTQAGCRPIWATEQPKRLIFLKLHTR